MDSSIRTQKFGLGDLLVEGWKLYRTGFAQILPIILFAYVPANIILVASNQDAFLQFTASLLELVLSLIATIAIAYIVDNKIREQSITWDKAMAIGLSKCLTAFFTGWLAGLIILGLTLLLIVPGIIWSLYYIFYLYVVALRNIDGKAALDYSKHLVKNQWWRVFGYSLAIQLLRFVAWMVIAISWAFLPNDPALNIVEHTIMDIVSALFTVIMVVFFLNTDYLRHPLVAVPVDKQIASVCYICGAKHSPGAAFCSSCGVKLASPVGTS